MRWGGGDLPREMVVLYRVCSATTCAHAMLILCWCHSHAELMPSSCCAVPTAQAAEEAARLAKEKEKELVTGNPLLGLAAGAEPTFNIKRRCARVGVGM